MRLALDCFLLRGGRPAAGDACARLCHIQELPKLTTRNKFAQRVAQPKYLVLPFASTHPSIKIRPGGLSKETSTRRRRLNLSTSDRFSANRGHPPVELKKTRSEIA